MSVERKAKIRYITRLHYTFVVNLETVVPAFKSKEDCAVDRARIRAVKQCLPTCAPRIHFRFRGLLLRRSLESFIKKARRRISASRESSREPLAVRGTTTQTGSEL